jgi:hypothetical protein
MKGMKALSIRQPWSYLICAGYKDIENRTWPTKFRGRVYIHAGKRFDRNALTRGMIADITWLSLLHPSKFVASGAVIGEVDIVDCVTESESPWFTGPYGFVLRNPVLYEQAIPCRGRLGLFEPEVK